MISFSDTTYNLLFILFSIVGYLLYRFSKRYEYWAKLDVPSLGFSKDIILGIAKNKSYVLNDRYLELAPHPYGGIYQASKPYLLVRDPELIKTILVKDFSHFTDRGIDINEELDPLAASIFNLSGQRWKSIRTKLVPTFSSVKLKAMYPLMQDCISALDRYLEAQVKTSSEFEVRQVMLNLTTDVIGTCAFGFDCNAIADDKSEFRRIGQKITPKPLKFFTRQVIRSVSPKIIPWLKWKGFDQEMEDFYMNVTIESKKNREKNQNKRNDFMQLLINLQHEEQKTLQSQNDGTEPLFLDHVLAAQVFVFFIAGFATTAATLAYCLRELALNPDVMKKLQEEIQEVSDAHGGKLDYEVLKKMPYMECVVSETLRKYPPVGFLDRICTKAYTLPNTSLLIKENTNIIIPVYSLHYDPEYFPDPQKFDPDRFNEENKSNIIPGTYLPFGDGPRICIGLRFAMMEIRAALSRILLKYTVHPTAKTQKTVVFTNLAILNSPRGGIHLRFQKRAQ